MQVTCIKVSVQNLKVKTLINLDKKILVEPIILANTQMHLRLMLIKGQELQQLNEQSIRKFLQKDLK